MLATAPILVVPEPLIRPLIVDAFIVIELFTLINNPPAVADDEFNTN